MFEEKNFNLPELEEKVLKFWKERNVFERSLEQRKGKKPFVFFEGPPTANGMPGIHHVLARSFKDIVLRYQTMRGRYVPRSAGWDTHGLPVEIQVEKELGLKSKKEIEQFGIAAFNKKCRESVWKFRAEWEKLTERIGFWLDMKHPYVTYENSYIESLWWIFSQVAKRKLLYKGHKVLPWCTRCGTALSSHELALGYKEVEDTSVYVKFKVKQGEKIGKSFTADDHTHILSWTTTPWTLPGNVALAVGKDIRYVFVEYHGERFILAADLFKNVLGDDAHVLQEFRGRNLLGIQYEPLFPVKALQTKKSHRIYAADFVTTTDGTGIVHTAVMYGEDDYLLGVNEGLPQHHTVSEAGHFTEDVKELSGMYAKGKTTENTIIDLLQKRGLLFKTEKYKHDYPHCWRCSTALLYYARSSWFIGMSKLRTELKKRNETVSWVPGHLKEGRFGEWLREVKDWAISRDRYWGTPLPIWECQSCEHTLTIGSLAELNKYRIGGNRYFLVRHGEADHNVNRVDASGPETISNASHLTEKGKTQAQALAKKFAKMNVDLIVHSPFARTSETAQLIAKTTGARHMTDERLREIDAGVRRGHPIDEIRSTNGSVPERFVRGQEKGESLSDVRTRMIAAFRDLEKKHSGKTIVVVGHGDPLWILSGAAQGLKPEEFEHAWYPEPGTVTPFVFPNWPFDETGVVDVHKPYLDEVRLACPQCKHSMQRVSAVADVWFDSGAMPFASLHYPFEHKKELAKHFPADYIAEGLDQTRGWFYTLLAVATLLKQKAPYRAVVTNGLVLDKNGQKMSKSKGNTVDPSAMIATYGADAVRWYFFTVNDPGDPKRFDEEDIVAATRRLHALVYNSFVFWKGVGGARTTPYDPHSATHVLDRWIITRLAATAASVTTHLDRLAFTSAAREIESFADDLSRWYIRRSRTRLEMATTLGYVLTELSKLLAPFIPFFADALYQAVTGTRESVHLQDWPRFTREMIDGVLISAMAHVRTLASDTLAIRQKAGIKVRQPLAVLRVRSGERGMIDPELIDILKDEINVKEITFGAKIEGELELDTAVTPELKAEGLVREFVRLCQGVRRDAKLQVHDEIVLYAAIPAEMVAAVEGDRARTERLLKAREMIVVTGSQRPGTVFDVISETKIDDAPAVIAVRKV